MAQSSTLASVSLSSLPWVVDGGPRFSPLTSNPVDLHRHRADLSRARKRQAALMIRTDPSSGPRQLLEGGPRRRSISYGDGPEYDNNDDDDIVDGFDDLEMRKVIEARRGREDFTSLVDFLKNSEPPPGNYMSIPYESTTVRHTGIKEKGRWSRLKRVGRRHSVSLPKPPNPFVLPDSAVSGITIGGHRHIAISIPLEAMPFADAVKPHYLGLPDGLPNRPVPRPPRHEANVRTFTDGDGLVTVLRATKGSGLSSAHRAQPHHYARQSRHDRQHASRTLVLSHVDQKTSIPTVKKHEKSISQSTEDSFDWCGSVGMIPSFIEHPPLPDGLPYPSCPREPQLSDYPARKSSITGDIRSTNATGPCALDTKTLSKAPDSRGGARMRRPSPIHEESQTRAMSGSKTSPRLVKSDHENQAVAVGGDTAGSQSQASIASRREKVRNRKKRDMEALRRSRGQDHLQHDDVSDAPKHRHSSGHNAPRTSQHVSRLALCPIQVVMDVKPIPALLESMPMRPGPRLSDTQSHSSLTSCGESTNHQTPFTSIGGSPLQKVEARDARDVKGDGDAPRQMHSFPQHEREYQTDMDMLRLYDSFRENRMLDAERRIQRLEHNGDIWLRALIPLLDDMNRTIKAVYSEKVESSREYADEEGSRSSGEKTEKAANPSRERLTARLAQRMEESSWRESASAADISGMGSIEPLMRELAGEARRRQQAKILDEEYYRAV